MSDFNLANGTTAINTILAEEANRIGSDIYSRTLHTSPWLDLTKQSAFADGMGYQQTTLVYDRAIATTDAAGGTAAGSGAWTNVGTINANANFTASSNQPLKDAVDSVQGGAGGVDSTTTDNRSFVQFNKQLKKYNLERAVIESPRISLEDLRFAAHRQEQLRAIMDIMTQVTRNTWEDRYRNEFEKASDNVVQCKAAGSTFTAGKEGDSIPVALGDVDAGTDGADDALVADANISNAVLDKAYFQLIRAGAGSNAYGRENGRPVFALVCSSEASYQLQTEAGFRDDVRYNNAKVSDLIAPLGIEKSFRGFYHLVDDLAPRFGTASDEVTSAAPVDRLVPIPPYSVTGGKATPNAAYESAEYEVAFILHPEVCEAQIPNPLSGGNGLSFDPVNYRGKFDWKNIANEVTNPDGTVGFFRGVLASATKPIKTEFGYAIIFKRTSSTPAA
jgi:hypothetical protein